jgi:hypothetical protein
MGVRMICFVALWSMLLSACAYGPKTENKSPLSVLNGENYETTPTGASGSSVMGVPIVKTKERATHVRGKVVVRAELVDVPVRFVKLAVFSNEGAKLQEATTDSDGSFNLVAILKNGIYRLEVLSPRYSGELTFEVRQYEIENIVLQARSKTSP